MPTIQKHVESLEDWPTEELKKVTIECAGSTFVDYYSTLSLEENQIWNNLMKLDHADGGSDDGNDDDDDEDNEDDDSSPSVDLFSLSETELKEIDYYKVLHLPYKPTISPDDVKKAYRKACLKYHPDKSGRDEEDAVFLKVKAAFETLSTSKQAYDSTEMPFDDSLPSESPSDFFKEYQPVFERNMHFDAKLLPSNKQSNNGSAKKKNNKRNKNNHNRGPPELGDMDTSIDQVHEFYDYWTHFDSWRDFTLLAARELETEDHVENAESRYEKRWYQKEIDRHAKKLKQLEVGRIATLVERAMAVDPRLIQERKRLIEEKERKQREKEQEALNKKKREQEAQLAEERRMEEEKKRKADEKLEREKEKKLFRKTKQAFRRYVGDALQELLEKEFALEDEVDLICAEMDRMELTDFNTKLDTKSAPEIVQLVKKKAGDLRDGIKDENDGSNGTTNSEKKSSNDTSAQQTSSSTTKAKVPFTKDELSALAKGIKKFPPGGANRWDAIANYINNLCRPDDPRTKEECIETFNQINKAAKPQRNGAVGAGSSSVPSKPVEAPTTTTSAPAPAPADTTNTSTATDTSSWTADEDQLLQNGLAKYPATMDKNERWTKIATEVPGKSKKDCVQRFKEIRNAIKATKK